MVAMSMQKGLSVAAPMVVARVDEAQAEPAEAILGQHGRCRYPVAASLSCNMKLLGGTDPKTMDDVDPLDRPKVIDPIVTPPIPR